jgi:hypothetical protein
MSKPKVHIQEPLHKRYSLCGKPWAQVRGGVVRSDTTPPVVFDEESGSVNAATCLQCCLVLRRSKFTPRPP